MPLISPLLFGLLSLAISVVVLIVERVRTRRWSSDRVACYEQEQNKPLGDLVGRLLVLRKAFVVGMAGTGAGIVCIAVSAAAVYLIYGRQWGNLLITPIITLFFILLSMFLNWWSFGVELSRIRELQRGIGLHAGQR